MIVPTMNTKPQLIPTVGSISMPVQRHLQTPLVLCYRWSVLCSKETVSFQLDYCLFLIVFSSIVVQFDIPSLSFVLSGDQLLTIDDAAWHTSIDDNDVNNVLVTALPLLNNDFNNDLMNWTPRNASFVFVKTVLFTIISVSLFIFIILGKQFEIC